MLNIVACFYCFASASHCRMCLEFWEKIAWDLQIVSYCLNLFKVLQNEWFIQQIGLGLLVQRTGFSVLAIVKSCNMIQTSNTVNQIHKKKWWICTHLIMLHYGFNIVKCIPKIWEHDSLDESIKSAKIYRVDIKLFATHVPIVNVSYHTLTRKDKGNSVPNKICRHKICRKTLKLHQ